MDVKTFQTLDMSAQVTTVKTTKVLSLKSQTIVYPDYGCSCLLLTQLGVEMYHFTTVALWCVQSWPTSGTRQTSAERERCSWLPKLFESARMSWLRRDKQGGAKREVWIALAPFLPCSISTTLGTFLEAVLWKWKELIGQGTLVCSFCNVGLYHLLKRLVVTKFLVVKRYVELFSDKFCLWITDINTSPMEEED